MQPNYWIKYFLIIFHLCHAWAWAWPEHPIQPVRTEVELIILDRRRALFGLCFYSLLAYISTVPAAASMAAVAVPGLTHEQ
jgi:hypothetical protein